MITGLISAAHTTSETLSMVIYQLFKQGNNINLQEIDKEWIDNKIDDLLRLYTTTQNIFRYAKDNIEIKNKYYPKGTIFQMNVNEANRNSYFYSEEQVLKKDLQPKCPFSHLSFSGGVHKCPGEELARLTIQITINTLVAILPNIRLDHQGVKLKRTKMITQPQLINILNN